MVTEVVGDKGAMTDPALDLFYLTFNCAKNLINVSVFAKHVQDSFGKGASGLPDVVVL